VAIVVLVVLTIFHGLKNGLGVVVVEGFAFRLAVVVVLVAPTIAVNGSLLSLLTLVFSVGIKVMVKVGCFSGLCGLLELVTAVALFAAVVWLLVGAVCHIGAVASSFEEVGNQ